MEKAEIGPPRFAYLNAGAPVSSLYSINTPYHYQIKENISALLFNFWLKIIKECGARNKAKIGDVEEREIKWLPNIL